MTSSPRGCGSWYRFSRRRSFCFACVALVLVLWPLERAAAQLGGRASPKTPRAHEEIVTEIDAGNLQKAHALWRDKLRKASSEAGDVKSVLDALAKNNKFLDKSADDFRDDFLRELMQWLLDEQPASPPAAKLRRELETAEWNLRAKGWELPRAPAQVVAGNRRRLLFPITATVWGKRAHVPRYRLFRLPMDLALEHLLPLHPALDPYPAELKSIPVETWQPVPIAVEIHQAAPGPLWQFVGGGADRLVADFAPGWYVLEREVNGLVVRSVLRSQTFELMCRWDRGQLVVYAVDVVDGRPIQDVEISLVSNANRDDQAPVVKLPNGRTNAEGWWQATTSEKIEGIDVIGVRGVEKVFESLSFYEYDAAATNLTTEEDRVFITTDRPIYRPGQTVHFKAVGRRLRQGGLTQLDASPVRVEIRDRKGRSVYGHEDRWNEFGTMSGEFQLGDEPSLGEYAVVVQVPRQPDDAETPVDSEDQPWKRNWNASFVVEAYRKPEVEVKVTPTLTGMSGQRRLRAQVSADYFLGGPVANAEVEWTVSCSPIAIAAMTDGSAFATWADLRNPLYAAHRARLREGSRRSDDFPSVESQPMATGTSRADSLGQLLIDLPIPRQLEGMEFEVRATVRDLSRLSAEGQGKIAAAKESGWAIDLAADRVWCEPGKPVVAFLEVTDEAGRSVADSEIELLTFWSDEIHDVQVKGEGQREWITVASSKLRTGRDGRTQATFTPHASGLLRWRARTKDQEGRRVERRLQQWIVGEGAISGTFGFETSPDSDEEEDFGDGRAAADAWFSRPTNLPLVVQPERVVYRPGETARLLVLSRTAPLSLFVSVDGAGFMRPRRIELKSRAQIIEIPVGEQDPHHLNVRVFGAAGAGRSAQAATFLLVDRPERRLDVRLTADKLSYRPREKARFVLETHSAEGRGVPSEVELAIVDDALYSLGSFRIPSIDTAFYPVRVDESVMFGGAIEWGVNSTAYGEALFFGQNFTARQGDAFTFHPRGVLGRLGGFGMGGGGGGGMAGMMGGGSGGGGGFFGGGGLGDGGAAADEEPAPTELRERLVDLWYWAAHVRTDEQGRAAVSLDVPDTLGRWRILARAVSKTDQTASVASHTLTTKPLLVRLAAPRFYTQGDEGTVSMIVRNDLTVAADCTVRLSIVGGEGGGEKRVTVPAGQQSRIDWTVKTPRPGTLTLKAEALSTRASDALELRLPVKPFGVAQRSTQSGTTRDRWTTQLTLPPDAIADSASLVIVADEPNVSAVRAALPSLMQYPYGCVEQTMSRFLPAVVAQRALRTSGLSDAAFESELPRLVESGLQRLYGFQHDDGGWGWWKDDVTDGFMTSYVVFGLLTAKEAGFSIDPVVLDRALRFLRPYDGEPLDEVVARMAKIALEPKTTRAEWNLKRIDEEERERHVKRHGFAATREERLAQLVFAGHAELASHLPVEPPQSGDPLAVRQVAWNIRARLSRRRLDPVVPKLVEWLLRQRQAGAWHSTLDTAYAVLALSELPRYMEARPKVTVVVNGQQVLAASEFPAAGLVVPASQLKKGENSVEVRSDGGGLLMTAATLRWHGPPREQLAEEARLAVGWKWERAQRTSKPALRADEDAGEEEVEWIPLASGAPVRSGEILRVTVTAKALESADRMFIESPLAAGTEAVRLNHASGDEAAGMAFYDATHHEFHDDRVLTAYQEIATPVEFTYMVRATLPGNYRVLPPTVAPMYEPDAVVAGASFGLRILARAE